MIGEEVRRKEDLRLITGKGQYADDLKYENAAYAAFVRSPHAHAIIKSIDTSAACEMPGVLAVLTGEDIVAAGIKPIPHAIGSSQFGSDIRIRNRDGSERARTHHQALPTDKARFVGEAVVMVVAESTNLAKDAAEAVVIDWEELPSVVRGIDAIEEGAPQLWYHVPGNKAMDGEVGDKAGTDAAFAKAAHVLEFESWAQRVTGVHMEPRSSSAEYDPETGKFTIHASGGHGVVMMREQIAASIGVDMAFVRVVAPRDVGGNFGTRNATYPEFVLLPYAAKLIGRPVKHQAERIEAFLSDFQGRDLHVRARLALDKDGRFLAFHSTNVSNIGAHTVSYTALNKGLQLMTSLYRVPVAHVEFFAAMTNTVPTIPYRSAGRPEAMYIIERMIDLAARKFGFDRVELRRINMIPEEECPYANPFGVSYDNGDYIGCMDKVLAMADWNGFEARRAEARKRGKYRGIGLSNYIEGTSGVPRERAEITVDPTSGIVDVVIGTQNTGQGHETAFAQLVGSFLGISHEVVQIRASDTDFVSAGGGSHSGRSLRFSSIVMHKATAEIIERGRKVAAFMLNVAPDAIDYAEGHFRARGSNGVVSLFEAAEAAEKDLGLPDELKGAFAAIADETTHGLAYPYGAAICEVEVDPDTGYYEIPRYSTVDDVGKALNPMIVDGQTHGGIVQGAGQAMYEWSHYDRETGQNLSATFMDYQIGRASDFPSFYTVISEVPAKSHPLGFRPGGEGGTTPSLGVVVNAITDALADLGVTHIEMPVTPSRIWQAIQQAKANQ
ncbi:xanthine dehydrogenase family protein molybdopterin-binding subunit [Neorhizobium petrolearium]|uniref:Xanthine dehydrogenase family protein molybdopterin-binding subunit n=1 Tax=Neorhizobium petrolearium TaxID=515361 RepID=A0ABY8MBK4_9HYPH|nr:xanthine dehydrogenase family protein molybdopterin-binding subunit [Neorhizobium petrolearium]MCC2613545.1 xanthine dehydrogenase family protein molybdopterin-binding subunit [Neorhizobium petrolearium]WGI71863.1 xanthine dehydrogenase family protein molybdopterin-binding subunit [Neorhizobium petrolearium]